MRFQTIALWYWKMNILYVPGIWNHYALKVKIIKPIQDQNVTKAWFSLAHKHKRRDIPTCRMAYLTQFVIPALLNPMVNKMVDASSAILLLICLHEVWVKVAYDWPTALCLCSHVLMLTLFSLVKAMTSA